MKRRDTSKTNVLMFWRGFKEWGKYLEKGRAKVDGKCPAPSSSSFKKYISYRLSFDIDIKTGNKGWMKKAA